MNTFILILQVLSVIIGLLFLFKSWNKETQTYEKESLKAFISCVAFFILLNYFKSSDIQINNIEEANNLLLNKSKTEIFELIGKPDSDLTSFYGEKYFIYNCSKRGVFYQLNDAGDCKDLRLYIDDSGFCYKIEIF
ncbi:MAG: hypothetical protein ACOVNP_02495 [Flavobacterium sp.]|jgi:hypothetical protein